MSAALKVSVEVRFGVNVVRCAGEIDLGTQEILRECLDGLTGVVSVDLFEVTFLDSTGLSVLVAARKAIEASGGQLRLHAPQGNVRQVLEITGLTDWILDYSVSPGPSGPTVRTGDGG